MVHATAVDGLKGGRLRVGMVGGGRNAFIGAVHRMAMRLDDLIELKAGALSSDAENARAVGRRSGSCAGPDLLRLSRNGRPRGGASGRHRGRRHRHPEPPALPGSEGVPRSRHRHHLRQALVDDARRGVGAGRAHAREGAHLCGDPEQHRLSDGAPGARNDRSRRNRRHPRRPHGLCPGLADLADRSRRTQAGGMANRSCSRGGLRGSCRHRSPRAQSWLCS